MEGDDLLLPQAGVFRHDADVGAKLAPVADRDRNDLRLRRITRKGIRFQGRKDLRQPGGIGRKRIVENGEGAVGRDDRLDPGRKVLVQERRHGPNLFIDAGSIPSPYSTRSARSPLSRIRACS